MYLLNKYEHVSHNFNMSLGPGPQHNPKYATFNQAPNLNLSPTPNLISLISLPRFNFTSWMISSKCAHCFSYAHFGSLRPKYTTFNQAFLPKVSWIISSVSAHCAAFNQALLGILQLTVQPLIPFPQFISSNRVGSLRSLYSWDKSVQRFTLCLSIPKITC